MKISVLLLLAFVISPLTHADGTHPDFDPSRCWETSSAPKSGAHFQLILDPSLLSKSELLQFFALLGSPNQVSVLHATGFPMVNLDGTLEIDVAPILGANGYASLSDYEQEVNQAILQISKAKGVSQTNCEIVMQPNPIITGSNKN